MTIPGNTADEICVNAEEKINVLMKEYQESISAVYAERDKSIRRLNQPTVEQILKNALLLASQRDYPQHLNPMQSPDPFSYRNKHAQSVLYHAYYFYVDSPNSLVIGHKPSADALIEAIEKYKWNS